MNEASSTLQLFREALRCQSCGHRWTGYLHGFSRGHAVLIRAGRIAFVSDDLPSDLAQALRHLGWRDLEACPLCKSTKFPRRYDLATRTSVPCIVFDQLDFEHSTTSWDLSAAGHAKAAIPPAAVAREMLVNLVLKYDTREFYDTGGTSPRPPEKVRIIFAPATPSKTSAMYFPDTENPIVELYRVNWIDPGDYRAADVAGDASDPLGELLILSHELGHHYALLAGLGTGVFDASKPLETYEQEVAAWLLARQLLEDQGFSFWAEFDRQEHDSLDGYRQGLRIEDAATIDERVRNLLAS